MCCQSITHLDCHEAYADEEASECKYAERRALDVEHDGVTAIQAVSAQDVTKMQCGKGVCAGCYKNAVREGGGAHEPLNNPSQHGQSSPWAIARFMLS